ncbi:peptidoglycan bridge formation glycyltransferase FemA/FemB family protein [Patescibacteria group bacterium]|nr:peptidoglycan bridge formation glycyltransferase FemA/FemB family protein [Patescibacteria group bacterium]MBU3999961.1 peptidoglycan bridge formation glycyltransferase FemA/FemB family protein [Patescibacteria group bacterium]MBU4056854.1 peptidoglycan bridge formation glycyltransferase FemA/FemB family protein [Patescibacteria group bacterium]
MFIKEIVDKSQWENFILSQRPDTFLQSWNWGESNSAMDDPVGQTNGSSKIFRLGIFDPSTRSGQVPEELVGVALIIKVSARRGKFLFCPHGPIIKKSQIPPKESPRDPTGQANPKSQTNSKTNLQNILNSLFDYLKGLAKKENADFIRISSLLENTPENLEIFQKYAFRDAPIHMMHPEIAWLLGISKSEEEIFYGMRKTARNLIRRAEREGVEITESKKTESVNEFYKLHNQTVSRHGFVPFSKAYLKKQFEVFSPENQISVFFAKRKSAILSAAIIVFYGHSAFYHHGASRASKIPTSHLLIWEAIKEAKKRGCEIFNFWGIAPSGVRNHPWAGLTFFKTGFGGYKKEYLHAQDLVIEPKYWLNYLIEKIRRFSRGY